jgi:DUF4097 and DUF4098 domain-containing protein YvlB
MIEKRIPVEGADTLTLAEMAQNVDLTGGEEVEAVIRADGNDEIVLTVAETETGPVISAQVNCQITVPSSLPVIARSVKGNLRVSGVDRFSAEDVHGNLRVDQADEAKLGRVHANLKTEDVAALVVSDTISGNGTLRTSGTVELQELRGNLIAMDLERLQATRISGNLVVKELDGPLVVERVGGNATMKGVSGTVALERVGGNLTGQDLTAGAKVTSIGGNLMLNGEIGSGCTYQFKAGGNGLVRLSPETSAHLTLSASGMIRSSLTLVDSEQKGRMLTGTLGDGGAEIVVEAGGNILLGGAGPTVGAGLSEEISRQIEASLRALDLQAVGEQISAEMERAMSQLRSKLENVDWDRVGQRTQRSMERAMERMQRDIDRATEKAARRQEKLERMAERAAWEKERLQETGRRAGYRSAAGAPFGRHDDEPSPNLDQERLAILRMVENGQIDPEEAEKLLDALE